MQALFAFYAKKMFNYIHQKKEVKTIEKKG